MLSDDIKKTSPAGAPVWPHSCQCTVLLTFDLDAETTWMSRDPGKTLLPVLVSQGRFGPKVGVPAILDLLRDFGLRSTFFVPSLVTELYPEAIEAVCAAGSEIGAHGHAHEIPGTIANEEEERILSKSVELLTRATGTRPIGYRAPFGQISHCTLELLERYGFDYASNMMDDIFPYIHHSVTGAKPLAELPIHWVLVDATFMQFSGAATARPIYSATDVLTIWKEEFLGIYERGALMNLILHPQIIGRPSRVRMLREFISYVQSFPGVWLPTAAEVAVHWRETTQGVKG